MRAFALAFFVVPSRTPTSFALLTSPPRKYVRIMQPIFQHAHNMCKKTFAHISSMRAFALALSETFVPSDSALLKAIPPKIRSLNAAHVLQKNALKVNFQHFFLHMCIFCSTFAP